MNSILIADDEERLLSALTRVFSSSGYRVLTARNGQEALDIVRRESLDVVLCDIKMPVKGAMAVLEEIKATYPELPVIVFTGRGSDEDTNEYIKKGAYDLVTKPCQIDYLLSVIRSAIDKLPPPRKSPEFSF